MNEEQKKSKRQNIGEKAGKVYPLQHSHFIHEQKEPVTTIEVTQE